MFDYEFSMNFYRSQLIKNFYSGFNIFLFQFGNRIVFYDTIIAFILVMYILALPGTILLLLAFYLLLYLLTQGIMSIWPPAISR